MKKHINVQGLTQPEASAEGCGKPVLGAGPSFSSFRDELDKEWQSISERFNVLQAKSGGAFYPESYYDETIGAYRIIGIVDLDKLFDSFQSLGSAATETTDGQPCL